MHYFSFNVGDHFVATHGMSSVEVGIYVHLLAYYYKTESPLPLDEKEIAHLAGARRATEKEALAKVLGRMFAKTDGGWRHTEADAEIAKYKAKAEANRTNGKLGGRPREPKAFRLN